LWFKLIHEIFMMHYIQILDETDTPNSEAGEDSGQGDDEN
jgi:hypothetical protein